MLQLNFILFQLVFLAASLIVSAAEIPISQLNVYASCQDESAAAITMGKAQEVDLGNGLKSILRSSVPFSLFVTSGATHAETVARCTELSTLFNRAGSSAVITDRIYSFSSCDPVMRNGIVLGPGTNVQSDHLDELLTMLDTSSISVKYFVPSESSINAMCESFIKAIGAASNNGKQNISPSLAMYPPIHSMQPGVDQMVHHFPAPPMSTLPPPNVASMIPSTTETPRTTTPYRGFSTCGKDNLVAITFDDGPSLDRDSMDMLLMELDDVNIRATFFATPYAMGESQLKPRCAVAKMLEDRGHSIQIHSWDHPKFSDLTWDEVKRQMDLSVEWYTSCLGHAPTQFRPPYGILSVPQARNITGFYDAAIALWSVESDDVVNRDRHKTFQRIKMQYESRIQSQESIVVLMHDSAYKYHQGLMTDIAVYFRKKGYSFVTTQKCYETCIIGVCKGSDGPTHYEGVFEL